MCQKAKDYQDLLKKNIGEIFWALVQTQVNEKMVRLNLRFLAKQTKSLRLKINDGGEPW